MSDFLDLQDTNNNDNFITYIEKINDSYIVKDAAGNELVLQDYDSQTFKSSGSTQYLAIPVFLAYSANTKVILTNLETGKLDVVTFKNYTGGTSGFLSIPAFNSYSGQTLSNIDSRLLTTTFQQFTGGTLTFVTVPVFNTYSGNTKILIDTKLDKTVFTTYTGNTNIKLNNLQSEINYVSGKTKTKLDIVVFDNYTANTKTYYNLSSPATCTVGGITAGTPLTGKTSFELFQQILAPELYGTLTNPSTSISLNPSTTTYEIGCNISSLSVCGTFNRGSINPQYCSSSPYRSGLPNTYNYTGTQVAGSYSCNALNINKIATNYVVQSGNQSWGISTKYDQGAQPKGSNGTNYNSPLSSGTTSIVTSSISGILPWYWGKGSQQTLSGTSVANGTKVLASANGTLSITYNSSSSDYIWFAVPQGTPTKTCWYVNGTNNGCIGGTGNLFANYCTLSVNSAQGCWNNCNYLVYVSCIQTGTAIGIPMCMS